MRGLLLIIAYPMVLLYSQCSPMAKDTSDIETHLQARWEVWAKLLESQKINRDHPEVFLRAFKEEKQLEVWAREYGTQNPFQKIWTTPICAASGKPGPKRREGDHQVPEGMYHIAVFNPKSKFYLSLGLNYPNASDSLCSDPEHPGSDIYIHGKCVSIGCLALGDDAIEQLYALTRHCKITGQELIPVMMLPCNLNGPVWNHIRSAYPEWTKFWEGLEQLNQAFEDHAQVPKWGIDEEGYYFIKN